MAVFRSYRNTRIETVEHVANYLSRHQVDAWHAPCHIPPGAMWDEAIAKDDRGRCESEGRRRATITTWTTVPRAALERVNSLDVSAFHANLRMNVSSPLAHSRRRRR